MVNSWAAEISTCGKIFCKKREKEDIGMGWDGTYLCICAVKLLCGVCDSEVVEDVVEGVV